ncbi:MAG: alpha-1,4-glucan--maltose-1-phosphate maltosyltransferase [Sphingomonas sp.]
MIESDLPSYLPESSALSQPSLRLLSIPAGADGGVEVMDSETLRRASEGGFGAVLVPVDLWSDDDLGPLGERCRAAGLALIADVDLSRFPLDHPLVDAYPGCFAIRRGGDRAEPIDPRRPMPATGEAIARLRAKDAGDVLAGGLAEELEALIDQGVVGFRVEPADRINPALMKRLVERLGRRTPGLQWLAGPPGNDREHARALAKAGCTYLISSFAWWDLKADWFVDEVEALRGAAPLLCELRDDLPSSGIPVATRLAAAEAIGAGVILPLGALDAAVDQAAAAAPGDGELRRLSGDSAPVTVLMRADGPDLRSADHATVIAINPTAEPQPLPATATLAAAGAPFFGTLPDALLQPGEVRVLDTRRAAPIRIEPPRELAPSRAAPRLVIEAIEPQVSGGDFAVKRVVGDSLSVTATIYTDGHEQLAAELRWRALDSDDWSSTRMTPLANDRWQAELTLDRLGRHEFVVEGWLDRFGGFQRDFGRKVDADVAQPVDHAEGREMVAAAARRSAGELRAALDAQVQAIDDAHEEEESVRLLLSSELRDLMDAADDRPHRLVSPRQLVDAERIEARFSSWYELFPRSQTKDPSRHGSFADVIDRLPAVRAMGFDTLYFPPIHPIGQTNRKGPNNTLTPGPDDPGSPYAIGAAEGGHDAIHPELGSFEDFDRLVAAARDHGLEIALDFAIQASPDHPWLTEHPGWFAWRPDGSMKYAENPPKKYQDIVNVDFYAPDAVPALWEALRDVILLWVGHGVKTFRVDNPHTKPLPFWEWMIADVRSRHPDVIFLSEAFTRPTMMYRLAKVGFSQSYTYFTWRDGKHELIEYIEELTARPVSDFYRPHFFVNTPDINPLFLQTSGRPGFRIRAVLAATLSGLFGVYSGFELCEAAPLGPGKEEYLDSEKYEVRVRDWSAPGNIIADITLLNRLRRAHAALQTHLNTRFYLAHNDNIIWYGKPSPAGDEMIMVMINVDPHHTQECDFEVPLWEFGLPDHGSIAVEDLAAGHRFDWHGKVQHIRLAPDEPYRLWRLSLPGERA